MKIGITGLAGAGKTSVFNLFTQNSKANTAGKMNLGSMKVPDERLNKLAEIYNPRKVVRTEIACTELSNTSYDGLFSGQALQLIQKMDALMLVIQGFESPFTPHPEGSVDPIRDIQKLIFDINFQDISTLDKRITAIQATARGLTANELAKLDEKIAFLKEMQAQLENGVAIREQNIDSAGLSAIGDTFLISLMPLMLLVNIRESDLPRQQQINAEITKAFGGENCGVGIVCVKLELELSEMDEKEQLEFRKALSAGETGLDSVIELAYETMGLISFLTVGKDEVRAWTIKNNTTAVKAAGTIHSDIERGFIRAEVIAYNDFMEAGGMATARKRGTLRQEGRDYVVRNGDIINFLFSV